jgi:GT2 family glycosyltransferase
VKKVSITIPSIYPHKLRKTLESIWRYTPGIDYEVVVIGPKELRPIVEGRENVKFILELEQKGAVPAQQMAYEASEGEYSVWLSDDVLVTEDWLRNMLNFLEENEDDNPLCGSFRMRLPSGRELEQGGEHFFVKVPFAMHGCMKTSTLQKLGGWDRGYREFCIDPDLGLRILHANGRVVLCPDAWIIHLVEDRDEGWKLKKKKRFAEDDYLFYKTWRSTLYKLKLQEVKDWRYWLNFRFVKDIINAIKILLRMINEGDVGRLLKIFSGLISR